MIIEQVIKGEELTDRIQPLFTLPTGEQGFYSSDALGDFLNDIYRSFTGKACKEV